jgi:hypothetical protein
MVCLLCILLVYRTIVRGDGLRIHERQIHKEFPQGRDEHARLPWDQFPDYYV